MAGELVVLGQQAIQQGGLGMNSPLFQLKPSAIELNQRMTRAEGAVPGLLRVTDTSEQFKEMQFVMLFEPVQKRSYFEGSEFSKDAQLCYSTDAVRPHSRAKVPQAMVCSACPMQSWDKYNQTRKAEDKPKCALYWTITVVDRVTRLPYTMNIRKTNIAPFVAAMGQVAKLLARMEAEGKLAGKTNRPNIFDVSFKVKGVPTNNGEYFNLHFFEFAPLAEADRADFGALFLEFANKKAAGQVVTEDDATPAPAPQAEVSIPVPDAAFTENAAVIDGEIVI